ncbi:T9SS type A sorting domain-containing protein [Xanthocytophaga agilis]|uniref:T9SS type A sorting domain-containing protein n=1 Tax=Xanthocytophaga agilis TaxID=3048010 RepID=A0AAE3RCD6_9BACT|nr:T9SS type A sorting domain-containing protein [Xanthocytophaga agilis]MDJ1505795.1 T9SS type A sorting domain-containing protein [Xanthocytophaga agilis]
MLPNPTTGKFTIVVTVSYSGPTSLDLYTANGKLINRIFEATLQEGQSKQVQYDGSNLSNGLYILHLHTPGKIQYRKLVINR